MHHLRKFVAPEFIFGAGCRLLAGRYLANFGARRPLVVSDAGVMAAGWTHEVVQTVLTEGLEPTVFSDVTPNPRADEVMRGVDHYLREDCDIILAVGGGSVIDCAKGIGVVCTNRGHILDYEGVDKIDFPSPPLVCIPTTTGSAADVSQFAMINDRRRRRKACIVSKAVVPDVSLIDPLTTTTLSQRLTAATGMDAMAHAMEAFASLAHSSMTDLHALEAIRLLRRFLGQAVANPTDEAVRVEVIKASMHAGLAFSNASLGAVHALAHSVGGVKDLPHGECSAALIEHVVAFNFSAAPERYGRIGEALGLQLGRLSGKRQSGAIFKDLACFKRDIGLGGGLAELGLKQTDVGYLADQALGDICLVTNPRPLNRRDIEVLYEETL